MAILRRPYFSDLLDAEPFGLFCPQCGYNLHGIPPRRCPECGFGYDPESILNITAAEYATLLRTRVSALIRAAYAVSAALPAFAWSMNFSRLATFILTLLAPRVCGILRRTCGSSWKWSWQEDFWNIVIRTLLLTWPAMLMTFMPTISSCLAAVLIADAIVLIMQSRSWLPELEAALPTLARYQVATMIALPLAVIIAAAPYF